MSEGILVKNNSLILKGGGYFAYAYPPLVL